MSGRGVDQKFALLPDDTKLNADGADTTRVVIRVTDELWRHPSFCQLTPSNSNSMGPRKSLATIHSPSIGGTGAIWIRAKEQPGTVTLTATHPVLGKQQVAD